MSNTSSSTQPSKQHANHVHWEKIPVESMNSLLDRQVVVGTNTMVARILMKKGALVPLHSHYHEQVSYIESGVLQFTIDGKELTVRAGECLCIPPDVPHSASALQDTVGIDFFTPPREDWLNKTDDYLRR